MDGNTWTDGKCENSIPHQKQSLREKGVREVYNKFSKCNVGVSFFMLLRNKHPAFGNYKGKAIRK